MTDPMTRDAAPDPALIEQVVEALMTAVHRSRGDTNLRVNLTATLAASDVLLVRRDGLRERLMTSAFADYINEDCPFSGMRCKTLDTAVDLAIAALSGGEAEG